MPESKKKLDDDSKKAEEVCESYAEFIIANGIQTIIFFLNPPWKHYFLNYAVMCIVVNFFMGRKCNI